MKKKIQKIQIPLLNFKQMNSITTYGLPAIIGIGIAWVGNRIIRNEKELKSRELELKLQLETKQIKAFK